MVATFLLHNLLPALLAGAISGGIVLLSIRTFRVRHAVTRLSLLSLPAIKSALVLLGINWVLPWPAEVFGAWQARAMPLQVAFPLLGLVIGGTLLIERLRTRRETQRALTGTEVAGAVTPRLESSLDRVHAAYAATPPWRGNGILTCVDHDPPRPKVRVSRASLPTPIALTANGTPTIVFPNSLAQRMSDTELDHVLAHELAHFMVGSSGWCTAIARALTVLSPIGPWMRLRLQREEEKACDEMAVRALGHPAGYAETLLACYRYASDATRARPTPLRTISQLVGTQPLLSERIDHLLAGHAGADAVAIPWYRALALWGFLLVVLFAEVP